MSCQRVNRNGGRSIRPAPRGRQALRSRCHRYEGLSRLRIGRPPQGLRYESATADASDSPMTKRRVAVACRISSRRCRACARSRLVRLSVSRAGCRPCAPQGARLPCGSRLSGGPAHSSRPDLGLNAVHAMAGVITQAVAYGQSLTNGPFDQDFAPPYSSLQVGVIAGGQAVNIIPDRCTADIEVRAVPGVSRRPCSSR